MHISVSSCAMTSINYKYFIYHFHLKCMISMYLGKFIVCMVVSNIILILDSFLVYCLCFMRHLILLVCLSWVHVYKLTKNQGCILRSNWETPALLNQFLNYYCHQLLEGSGNILKNSFILLNYLSSPLRFKKNLINFFGHWPPIYQRCENGETFQSNHVGTGLSSFLIYFFFICNFMKDFQAQSNNKSFKLAVLLRTEENDTKITGLLKINSKIF